MRQVVSGIDNVVQQTSTSETKIAPPSRAQNAAATPTAFLVHDMHQTTYDALLYTRVWATQNITFELFPFNPAFPTFLFPLEGFITPDKNRIRQIILHTWETDTVYDEFVAILARDENFPANLTADDITTFLANSFKRLTESLHVEFLDYKKPKDVPSPIFNVFATLATRDPKAWDDLRAVLENIKYPDPLNGNSQTMPNLPRSIPLHTTRRVARPKNKPSPTEAREQ
ncbi:hypothetical protein JVU11DRAFT_9222 [Chiua virens]|nr:hypothetical protein JVU11DRAFT_9222 [Chiua virens]